MPLRNDGIMVILSSPSCAGKTTLVKLLSKNKNFFVSISHTTRKPRQNEIRGKDYHFVSDEEFKRLKRGETGKAAKLNEVGLEVERTGRVAKRKATDAARSVQQGARRAANSMPRAPSLSKDAVFWFAVIAALAFLPTLISVLSGPVQTGGGVYV